MLTEMEWKDDMLEKIICDAYEIDFKATSFEKRSLIKFYDSKIKNFLLKKELGDIYKSEDLFFKIDVVIFEELQKVQNEKECKFIIRKTIDEIFKKIRRENRVKV